MSVYFVTCREASAVKIGSSLEPHVRLKEIQWGCPLLLKLEAVLPGGFDEERAFHARFADARIRGEWFKIVTVIEDIISANPPSAIREHAAASRPIKRESPRQRDERLHDEFVALTHRAARKRVEKAVAAGDIYFPFREPVASEDGQ